MYQVGEKFGDYEVIQVLGAGGMGEVYKVRNTLSDRFEAMKVLLPNLQQQADLVDRFMREIKVQATLQHKNIAGLHTAQRQGDKILMFIEFVDGMTLDKPLRRGPLGPELAANIIGQVLDALAYAHARGIVHRDIKPENIMVQPDGVVKLMDFGIARLAQDRRLTSTGRTVGSLYYMSPEQIRGADDLDGRSDLYSLGVTLYECVTGRRPFEGDSDYSIMAAHIQQNPVPPVQLDPQVPAALNDVILMAIAKDRAVRFQSADAFRAALQASVSGQSAVNPSTLVQPAAYGAPPAPAPTTPLPGISATPPHPPTPPRVPTTVMPQPAPPPPPPPAMMPGPQPVGASGAKGLIIGLVFLFVAAAGAVAYVKGPEWFGSNTGEQKKDEPVKDPGPVVTPTATTTTPGPGDAGKAPVPLPSTAEDGAARPTQPTVSTAKTKASPAPQPQTSSTSPAQTTPTEQQQQQQQQQPAASNPAPATPARRTYQLEPPQPQQQQQPQVNPQLAREMAEAREKFNSLSIRYSTAQESLSRLQAQLQRQNLGLRRDIREAATRFQYLMKEASDSLQSRNVEAARTSLDMAERNLDRIEKFLGN